MPQVGHPRGLRRRSNLLHLRLTLNLVVVLLEEDVRGPVGARVVGREEGEAAAALARAEAEALAAERLALLHPLDHLLHARKEDCSVFLLFSIR